ncbi:hypothetical protein [Streptomyces sioyaensis]|uniref:hypothetical protein n=1 Tax=Streptomyces sioyaensis TaxID=67364 RepID=UPI003D71352F
MSSTQSKEEGRPQQDARDRALAYPEPAPHPNWHRHGPAYGPLSPTQQRHNQEQLLLALRTHRTLAKAS